MEFLAAAILGYLLGSVPFAVIVSKLFGLADPRTVGSGNPGATNVLRSGNKWAAALTLVGDAAKGWLAMFLATRIGAGEAVVATAGLAAFIGHIAPFTLGFKGGKGVATALGVLLWFDTLLALSVAGVWLITLALFRYSSLSALAAAVAAPLIAVAIGGPREVVVSVLLMSIALIARHRSNIRKLLARTEPRLGAKKPPQVTSP